MENFKIKRIVGLQRDQIINNDNPILMPAPDWANPWDFNDKVILAPKYYKILLDKDGFNGKQSSRGIVVIKYKDRKIYRMFYSKSIGDQLLGLTSISLQELKIMDYTKLNEITVEIDSGNQFFLKYMYFFRNPHHEIRIPFKLSIFSVVLALLAFIPMVIQIIQYILK